MTIYLHIGMQKTGTTSLQRTMADKRQELQSHGILYPSGTAGVAAEDHDAHHYLAHAIRGRRQQHSPNIPFELLSKHVEALHEAAATFAGDMVISSEDFSLFGKKEIQSLRTYFPADTKIVIYLRRQDFWADALYGQMMKVGRQVTVEAFLKTHQHLLNYCALVEKWETAFGLENIIVRSYEGAVSENSFGDFCTAIGRASAARVSPEVRRDNVSLTQEQMQLLDLAGSDTARKRARRDFERANASAFRIKGLHHLSGEQASELLREHRAGNEEIAMRYLNKKSLFENLDVAREATKEEVSHIDITVVIGAISQSLHRGVENLKKIIVKPE